MYLFDTNYIIDLINEDPGAVGKAKEFDSIASLKAISVITVQEYFRGIYYLFSEEEKMLDNKLKKAEQDLSPFEILQLDYLIAKIAAEIDAILMKKGTQVNVSDVLIAATALRYNLIIVTRNIKHFEKIQNIKPLKIESY